jgi:hypothetical protein
MTAFNHQAHLAALGKLSYNLSMVEMSLKAAIHKLLGTSVEISVIVTSELSYRALVNLASALLRYKLDNPAKINEFENLLKEANTLEQERNKYVHSLWLPNEDNTLMFRMKTTAKSAQGLRQQFEPADIEQIDRTAMALLDIGRRINLFSMENLTGNSISGVQQSPGKNGA